MPHKYKKLIWIAPIIASLFLGAGAGALMNRNMDDGEESRGRPEEVAESQQEPSETSDPESQQEPSETSDPESQQESGETPEAESQQESSDALEADFLMYEECLVSYIGTDNFVEIPDGVETIGSNAFADNSTLQAVSVPDSVENIELGAFQNCVNLEQVSLPASCTWIGPIAFLGCTKLEHIDLPEGIGDIGASAFSECRALKEVDIPSTCKHIGYGAFSYCDSLREISVSKGNPEYESIDGILYSYDGKTLVSYPAGTNERNVIIRDGVANIEFSAFQGCNSIQKVTIPDSVGYLGPYAFCDCTSLSSIIIPKSVSTIPSHAFTGDTKLKKVTICNSDATFGVVDPNETSEEPIFEINTVICAPAGSRAEKYAKENGLSFEELPVSSQKTIPYLTVDIAERFELADFVGGDYGNLLSETDKVSILKEKDDAITIGNENVSITATQDGMITRIRLDSDDYDYCVEGLYSNLGTSDAHYILYNNGYVEGNGSEDGKWRVFTNEEKGRFVAYIAEYANIDKLYYGLIGYMPFKTK